MKRSSSVLLCSLLLAAVLSVAPLAAADNPPAQTSQYSLGDQTLTINAGLFVPLFLLPTWTPLVGSSPPHLSLGGDGYLSWAAYVTPHVRLGIDVAGTFSFDPNNNALLMLPFIAKVSYSFNAYPFEIPISLGVGMNVIKYTDLSTIDLLVKPGVALYWIYDSSWSFGLNLGYWFDVQFDTNPANSRVGNFLDISLGALYHY
ncbi:MAG TPA: hypothetical protein VFH83_01760 [Spirochaetia bacterium]|nr:hypothetical protein [Spirochaetia bacterium]